MLTRTNTKRFRAVKTPCHASTLVVLRKLRLWQTLPHSVVWGSLTLDFEALWLSVRTTSKWRTALQASIATALLCGMRSSSRSRLSGKPCAALPLGAQHSSGKSSHLHLSRGNVHRLHRSTSMNAGPCLTFGTTLEEAFAPAGFSIGDQTTSEVALFRKMWD